LFEINLNGWTIGKLGRGEWASAKAAEDILGNNQPPYPRHSKQYRNMYKMKEEMQRERIAGFTECIRDVQDKKFPASEHVIKAQDDLIAQFLNNVGSDS
jgi:3-methyl-2-oxobutanoate hydroxymethyltransferase